MQHRKHSEVFDDREDACPLAALEADFFEGGDGTGVEAMSEATRSLLPRHDGAQVARSVCPYCAAGCGQLVFHRGGRLVSIEGDPQSPI